MLIFRSFHAEPVEAFRTVFQKHAGCCQFGSGTWEPVTLRLSKGDLCELAETPRPNPLASVLPSFFDPNL
jgi:hypothetical protein